MTESDVVVRETHCFRGHPRFGRSASSHPRSLSEAALRSRSIECREPRGSRDHLVSDLQRETAYDAIWVKLRQSRRGRAAGFHDVGENIYILAGTFSGSVRLQFDS